MPPCNAPNPLKVIFLQNSVSMSEKTIITQVATVSIFYVWIIVRASERRVFVQQKLRFTMLGMWLNASLITEKMGRKAMKMPTSRGLIQLTMLGVN